MDETVSQFEPTEDYILCEQAQEADKVGSIVIPESARLPLTQGVVLKAGTSCDQKVYCKGRVIIFRLHTEDRIKLGSKTYIIVNPVNVLMTGPVLTKV